MHIQLSIRPYRGPATAEGQNSNKEGRKGWMTVRDDCDGNCEMENNRN